MHSLLGLMRRGSILFLVIIGVTVIASGLIWSVGDADFRMSFLPALLAGFLGVFAAFATALLVANYTVVRETKAAALKDVRQLSDLATVLRVDLEATLAETRKRVKGTTVTFPLLNAGLWDALLSGHGVAVIREPSLLRALSVSYQSIAAAGQVEGRLWELTTGQIPFNPTHIPVDGPAPRPRIGEVQSELTRRYAACDRAIQAALDELGKLGAG